MEEEKLKLGQEVLYLYLDKVYPQGPCLIKVKITGIKLLDHDTIGYEISGENLKEITGKVCCIALHSHLFLDREKAVETYLRICGGFAEFIKGEQ